MGILRGTIYITGSEEVIYNINLNSNIKIINLDEDGILMENPAIIGGTCLLPPIEAKIAEADGNEALYDTIYSNHLLADYQQMFIGALLTFLYRGGNLMLFLPELGYVNTKIKFIQFMLQLFGIHIGMVESNDPNDSACYYDDRAMCTWLNLMYGTNGISCYEYLYLYPAEARLNNTAVMSKLINDINPYCKSYNEAINYVASLHKKIHYVNPKARPAFTNINRME